MGAFIHFHPLLDELVARRWKSNSANWTSVPDHVLHMLLLLLLLNHRKVDPEKCLRPHWETCKFVDGLHMVQSLAVRVEGGATEPQVVVVGLIFIIIYPARSFFRSVDQMLPAAKGRVMSATEASQMSHFGLGHLGVFSTNEVWWVCGSVERGGEERSRTGTPNDGSAGGSV